MGFILVYTTCGSEEEAERISEVLVERELVACANIFSSSVKSVYEWQGSVEKEDETALLLKTREERWKELKRVVKQVHSYDTPAIIKLEAESEKEFSEWVREKTSSSEK